ncbi:hypothetical protein RYX36_001302 [Vicia faba]
MSLEVKNELQEADGKNSSIGKNNQVHAKHNVVASESLHATKKLKHMNSRDDLASGHIPKDVKTVLPCSTFVALLLLKTNHLKYIKNGNNAHSEKSDAAKLAHENSSELEEEKADEATPVHIPLIQDKLDSKQFPSKVTRVSSASPVKSPQPVPATTKSNAERNKSSISLLKASSISTPKKADNGSSKSSHNLSSSQNQVSAHKKKLASSAENSKTTPKTLPQEVDIHSVDFKESEALHVDRLEEGMEERSNVHTGSGTPKTSKTMKHLIVVAQAKWEKAHSQYLSSDIHDVQGGDS